jgi:succinoglycan biosynthesis transport protein ExoP
MAPSPITPAPATFAGTPQAGTSPGGLAVNGYGPYHPWPGSSPWQEEDEGGGSLKLVLAALERRRRVLLGVVAASLLVGGLSTLYQRVTAPVYQGGFRLLVSHPLDEGRPGAGGSNDDAAALQTLALNKARGTATPDMVALLRSSLLLKGVAEKNRVSLEGLQGSLSIGTPDEKIKGILDVALRWRDRQEGERLLNAISKEYLDYSLRYRQEQLEQGITFLDRQFPLLQQRVAAAQNELEGFRKRYGVLDPATQAGAMESKQQSSADELASLQVEEASLQARLKAIRSGRFSPAQTLGPGAAPTLSGQAALSAAPTPASTAGATPDLPDLSTVERQLAEAEANYLPSSPQVQTLRQQRDLLKSFAMQQALNSTGSQLSEIQAKRQQIVRQQQATGAAFTINPALIKRYEQMQQRMTMAQEQLTSYIQAREGFRLQVAQRTVPWQVITPPVFGTVPVEPNLREGLMRSLGFGLAGGVALALLRDRLDHVYHDPRDLEKDLGVPLLGAVPNIIIESGQTVSASVAAMESDLRFALKETLRNLFANFRMLRADKAVQLITITSSTQGEGKTTTTALFAQTLSDVGQRVLLVDADMRRPMLHRYLGQDNHLGLSSLLTDSQQSLAELVQPVNENLDLITAGPMPPDATKLLSSDRCGEVVEQIRTLAAGGDGHRGYDIVIFDTPPALQLSDPVLLSAHLDGLLFLVGLQRVDRSLPAEALKRIQRTRVDVLGVVANHVEEPTRSSYAYGYGYSYGYGYGYGYGSRYGYAKTYAYLPSNISADGKSVENPEQANKESDNWLRKTSGVVMSWFDKRR